MGCLGGDNKNINVEDFLISLWREVRLYNIIFIFNHSLLKTILIQSRVSNTCMQEACLMNQKEWLIIHTEI